MWWFSMTFTFHRSLTVTIRESDCGKMHSMANENRNVVGDFANRTSVLRNSQGCWIAVLSDTNASKFHGLRVHFVT